MDSEFLEELRQKYIQNPPEEMTAKHKNRSALHFLEPPGDLEMYCTPAINNTIGKNCKP